MYIQSNSLAGFGSLILSGIGMGRRRGSSPVRSSPLAPTTTKGSINTSHRPLSAVFTRSPDLSFTQVGGVVVGVVGSDDLYWLLLTPSGNAI